MNYVKTSLLLAVIVILVGAAAFYWIFGPKTVSNELKNPKRIAVLTASDLQLTTVDGIKEGLKELGYTEGSDYVMELNNPKGDTTLIKKMADEILASKPDLIVSLSTSASKSVENSNASSSSPLPVVAVDVGNFAELGIKNIQHPGGFITGVIVDNIAAAPKRMEILKIIRPNLKKVAAIVDPTQVSYNAILSRFGDGAKRLDLTINFYKASKKEDIAEALSRAIKDGAQAFMLAPQPIITNNPGIIAPVLRKAKIISIDNNVEVGVQAGYFADYGITRIDTGKQGARLIDKVLKGANPGDIPVEFASTITFELNGALAKEMGISIPESLLLQANKVY